MERYELLFGEDLAEFVRGMPESYARLFEPAEMREHQRIISGRGRRQANAGIWQSRASEGTAICVVAEARPGILSLVTDALSGQDLDVIAAHLHQRTPPRGKRESVTLAWVQRDRASSQPTRIDAEDVREVAETLEQLIQEQERADEHARESARQVLSRADQVRVYYDTRAMRSGECVLVIEAPDCPGLLLAVTRALFRQHAEIVASEVRTDGGLARDRFTISGASGARLTPDRLADVQQGVLFGVRRLVARQFSGEHNLHSVE